MSTPDGITSEDWDVVHDIALDVVNAPDSEKPYLRDRLLKYLDALEAKYGPLPSLLATRADYLDESDPAREGLLLRAHALAESRKDPENLLYVSHSLVEFYLQQERLAESASWLSRMRQNLIVRDDSVYSKEYERLMAEYRRLAINSAGPLKPDSSTR